MKNQTNCRELKTIDQLVFAQESLQRRARRPDGRFGVRCTVCWKNRSGPGSAARSAGRTSSSGSGSGRRASSNRADAASRTQLPAGLLHGRLAAGRSRRRPPENAPASAAPSSALRRRPRSAAMAATHVRRNPRARRQSAAPGAPRSSAAAGCGAVREAWEDDRARRARAGAAPAGPCCPARSAAAGPAASRPPRTRLTAGGPRRRRRRERVLGIVADEDRLDDEIGLEPAGHALEEEPLLDRPIALHAGVDDAECSGTAAAIQPILSSAQNVCRRSTCTASTSESPSTTMRRSSGGFGRWRDRRAPPAG